MSATTENPDACSRCGTTREHLHVFESRPDLQFCADCAAELLAAGGVAKFEKTIADELREAAARLRKVGSKVMPGPWESLNDGDRLVAWRNVPGTDFDDDMEYVFDEPLEKETAEWIALVNPDLAEPLARWLEDTATVVTSFKVPTHPLHEPCDDPVCYTAHPALAVARVLNGGVS